MTPKYKQGEKLKIVGRVWGTSGRDAEKFVGLRFVVNRMRLHTPIDSVIVPKEPLYIFQDGWSVQESAVQPVGGGFKRWAQQFK